MKQSSVPAAAAKFFVALALVAGSSPARADEPAEPSDEQRDSAIDKREAPVEAPAQQAEAEPAKKEARPPVVAPPGASEAPRQPPPDSWFAREPLTLKVGEGDKGWAFTVYGYVEADAIVDTTRSYDERISSTLVARGDTYEGHHGRTQFSIRNTRLGFKLQSPTVGGVKPSAVIETDFYGPKEDPSTTDTAEKTTTTLQCCAFVMRTCFWRTTTSTCSRVKPTTCSAGRIRAARSFACRTTRRGHFASDVGARGIRGTPGAARLPSARRQRGSTPEHQRLAGHDHHQRQLGQLGAGHVPAGLGP